MASEVVTGQVSDRDCSAPVEIIPGQNARTLSVKKITISSGADVIVTVQNKAGEIVFPALHVKANEPCVMDELCRAAWSTPVAEGMWVKCASADPVSVAMEAYLDAA
jgi:hypothetical protein